ncbi:LRR receptor-like serine threonine-protein kinase [Musa troglodytarum]|uniref:LRR receptor-like serine threonine-protein kinase n=1 Tax=Musa troglodytarum TaxID=320322 RepID=A0A9E7JR19_9LILI|nr:LRR receptor-like serine threonine-protein kinase [Musa troglodytarum]
MGGRTTLLVLTFSLAVLSIELGISHGCREKERKALIDFKRGLHDPSNRLSSWVGEDCCAWEGVGCSNISGHVIKLDLRNRRRTYLTEDCTHQEVYYLLDDDPGCNWALRGDITPSLCSLQQLSHLDLSGNYFLQKPIPKFIGAFRRLTYLNLSGAGFMGRVPDQLGNLSTLQHLDLSYNCYRDDEGTFPRSLSHVNFTSLITLDLRYNDINSTIPDWVFNITSLEYLYLGGNGLYGFFPDSVTKLTSLRALDLSGSVFQDGFMQVAPISNICKLQILYLRSVPIHDVLANLEMVFSGCLRYSMEELDLSNTHLSGSFPDWLGNIKNLKSLNLSFNSLYGSVPASIGNLSLLQHLVLCFNDLNGAISEGIGQLKSLVYLDLNSNSLSLSEVQLANLSSLRYLDISSNCDSRKSDLSSNKLVGGVPDSLCNLQTLESLHLRRNNLSGPIPLCLKSCTELVTLDLGHNNFIGNIPTWIGESLLYLKTLSLRSNAFTGSIPQLSSLTSLRILDLSNNNLSGIIPQSFGNFSAFLKIIFQESFLIAEKSPQSLVILDLSRNKLQRNLKSLDLSYNFLYGSVPASLANLSSLQSLILYSNELNGTISEAIGGLKGLIQLDLYNNSFRFGDVPQYLPNLMYLYLSNNSLSGHLPPRIANIMPYLEDLDLSNNSFSGQLPLGISDTMRHLQWFDFGDVPQYLPNLMYLDLSNNSLTDHLSPRILNMMPSLQFLDLSNNKIPGFIVGFWTICGSILLNSRWRIAYFQAIDNMCDELYVVLVLNVAMFKRKLMVGGQVD